MTPDLDIAIVGAGLMGAATAWAATRRGLSTAVLEQFTPGHKNGSSHGSARIVRRAYADPLYVRMTGQALELWRELETDAATTLLRVVGGLDHGRRRDAEGVAARLADAGVPYELLPADEAERRWPGMRFDSTVLFHPDAGTLDADRAIAAFLERAGARGAEVRHESAVRRITVLGEDAVRLETHNGESITARRAVVAAGAWVADLVGDLAPLPPLAVTEEQVFHFPRHDPAAPPWPTVVHKDRLSMYSLPGGRDGGHPDTRKVGEHQAGRPTTAGTRDHRIDPVARERATAYVREWLPGLVPEPFHEATCLYTTTPNEDFILDRRGPLVVCSPCSGHGAKFAPLIGETAADLAVGTAEPEPRFALK